MPFCRLIGHGNVLRLLSRAVGRGSLPPSLIFAGPEGVGKLTAAVALAEVLNCAAPVRSEAGLPGFGPEPGEEAFAVDACGECAACRRVSRALAVWRDGGDTAIDCLRLVGPDDKDSIKVDVVREVLARTAFRPFDGRRRVIVIDRAECLEVSSQNALLKALEEPPPGTVFVLVTASPDALLQTVRSRCPRMRFGPLAVADLARTLEHDRGFSRDEARLAAGLAGGSLSRALAGAGDERLESRRIAEEVLALVAGSEKTDVPRRLDAAQRLTAKAAGRRGAAAATRAQVANRLGELAWLLRDVGVVSSRADERWLANADLAPDLARLAAAFDGDRLVRAFRAVDHAQAALERSVNQKALADWLAFQL
jgi:DNA polymerase-3 subunit delta'